MSEPVVADLGTLSATGRPGAVWSLPHGGDLDANLVRLHPDGVIDTHVNDDVDVLIFVQSGSGELTVDGTGYELRSDVLAMVPKGSQRRIVAGPSGVYYLGVHRRRSPLTISPPPGPRP
jgi:mannose-6-phosphate isomerase-like protein (cupin superfamily)